MFVIAGAKRPSSRGFGARAAPRNAELQLGSGPDLMRSPEPSWSSAVPQPSGHSPTRRRSLQLHAFDDQAQAVQAQAGLLDGSAHLQHLLLRQLDFLGAHVVV